MGAAIDVGGEISCAIGLPILKGALQHADQFVAAMLMQGNCRVCGRAEDERPPVALSPSLEVSRPQTGRHPPSRVELRLSEG